MIDQISFSLLDDLLLAHSTGRVEIAATRLQNARFVDLCPALEYYIQQISYATFLPPFSRIPHTIVTGAILTSQQALDNSISLNPKNVEIRPIPRDAVGIGAPAWTAFQQRLKIASEEAGFSNRTSAGIAGAFGEMVDNAIIHSDEATTMLAGYHWKAGAIAYCVADNGIGVLRSLRKCRDFNSLDNHASALTTAVQDGASRFGNQNGRGLGFKQVLKSLAGFAGELRFRSGDFSLELDGRDLTFVNTTVSQKVFLQGLTVSVVCRST